MCTYKFQHRQCTYYLGQAISDSTQLRSEVSRRVQNLISLSAHISSKRYICVCKYVREVIGVSKPVISNAGHAK